MKKCGVINDFSIIYDTNELTEETNNVEFKFN